MERIGLDMLRLTGVAGEPGAAPAVDPLLAFYEAAPGGILHRWRFDDPTLSAGRVSGIRHEGAMAVTMPLPMLASGDAMPLPGPDQSTLFDPPPNRSLSLPGPGDMSGSRFFVPIRFNANTVQRVMGGADTTMLSSPINGKFRFYFQHAASPFALEADLPFAANQWVLSEFNFTGTSVQAFVNGVPSNKHTALGSFAPVMETFGSAAYENPAYSYSGLGGRLGEVFAVWTEGDAEYPAYAAIRAHLAQKYGITMPGAGG